MASVKPVAREAKTRAPMCANSVVDPTSLSTPSDKKLCRDVRGNALLSANIESLLTLLVEKVLHNKAKFASKGRTKAAKLLLQVKLP